MNSVLTKLTAAFAVALGFLALLFRGRAQQQKAKADKAEQQADAANVVIDHNTALQQAQADQAKQHKQEQRDEAQQIADGDRSHLDNNW